MSHTSWIPAIRRAMVTLGLVTAMTAGAPLFARQLSLQTAVRQQGSTTPPQTATPQTQQTPQAPAGPTVEISMDQAVAMALDTNLDLKANRFNQSVAAQGIAAARAAFLPSLRGNIQRVTSKSVTENPLFSTSSISTGSTVSGGSTYAQALPWNGASYSVNWTGQHSISNSISNFNPLLRSTLSVQFNQPLWRGFRIDNSRYSLENAQRGSEIADLQVQQAVLVTQDSVRLAYLNLVGAIATLSVARDNQNVNEVALRNARARIAVGNAAEIDAIQSEAAVRSSEEFVIVADANVASAEDVLRSLILDPARPDYWQLHIVPTDEIEVTPRQIDVDAAIKAALANRLDLTVSHRQIDVTRLQQRLNADSVKPAVDLGVNYFSNGTGGILNSTDASGNPVSAVIPFGSVIGDAFGNRNPNWTLNLQVAYPLGQTASKVAVARTEIQIEQQQLSLRSQELQIVQQVRDAARRVESGYRRVQSTQLALTANEQQLRAEERKQEVGMSSQFDVLQRQQLLANARSAALNARIDYNRALITFERVQHIR